MGNTISVMIPSRGRPEQIRDSIRSLGGVHEVLVAVDKDDPKRKDYYFVDADIKATVGEFEPMGYERLNEYYNQMAESSTGDWLLLWNDDCIMETEDWQEKIAEFDSQKPCVLNIYKPGHNYFPVVSRPFYEALGTFSESPNSDSWVMEIAQACGVEYDVPGIEITHLRGVLNDETERNSLEVAPKMAPIHAATRNKEMKVAINKIWEAIRA